MVRPWGNKKIKNTQFCEDLNSSFNLLVCFYNEYL